MSAATETLPATALPSRRVIMLVFLVHALVTGGMFARIPDIQQNLGMSEGTLGLTLIGQPVGAILMFLFASRILETAGTRVILLISVPLLGIFLCGVALASTPLALFLAFTLFGAAFALTNVAMNVEADRIEAVTERRVMNTCHGVWSAGQLLAALLGTLARGYAVSPLVHFAAAVPLVLLAAVLVIAPMRPAPARAHLGGGRKRMLSLPTIATLLLVGFALGAALLEAASRNWSVIYMRDSFAAPDWVDTLALPAFIGATAVGRFFADAWTMRFGPVRVARTLNLISLGGLVVVVFAPNLYVALAGFMLIGVGVCVSYPLTTSAAARLGDRPSSENVAALTLATQVILLGAPALLGFVADGFGIRTTFAVVAPAVVAAWFLARYLTPKR